MRMAGTRQLLVAAGSPVDAAVKFLEEAFSLRGARWAWRWLSYKDKTIHLVASDGERAASFIVSVHNVRSRYYRVTVLSVLEVRGS